MYEVRFSQKPRFGLAHAAFWRRAGQLPALESITKLCYEMIFNTPKSEVPTVKDLYVLSRDSVSPALLQVLAATPVRGGAGK